MAARAKKTAGVPPITEKEWQAQVIKLATMLSWKVFHTHDSRRSTAGYPDLTLVRRSRVVFAELKTDTGRVVRMTPTYTWARPCDAGACPARAKPGPVAATMTEGV